MRAPPRRVEVDVEQDDDVAVERRAHALGVKRPAAEGDDAAVGRLQQRAGELLLGGAEGGLAVAREHVGDRPAELGLEQRVRVVGRDAERGGGLARRARLARPHEADEDEGRVQRRRHPMRSSYRATASSTSSTWSPPNFSR